MQDTPKKVEIPKPTLMDVMNKLNKIERDIEVLQGDFNVAADAIKELGKEVQTNSKEVVEQIKTICVAIVQGMANIGRERGSRPIKQWNGLSELPLSKEVKDKLTEVKEGDSIKIEMEYLKDDFKKVAGILKGYGFEYVSAGRGSHFIKKAE